MAELMFDVIEQILLRLNVIDLLRFKKVCKSWFSLISSPFFVKAHLNYTCSINHRLRDKRIMMHNGCSSSYDTVVRTFSLNKYHIVGSSNGLVCISPKDVELLVTNPLTREVKCLPMIPGIRETRRPRFCLKPCWGFGYDSSTDDYKVIVGFGVKGNHRTRFHALTLKSNVWKLIGDIKYKFADRPGILCEGSLHWFMNNRKNKRVIISFDLSLEEFKEIPQPDDYLYKRDRDEDDILGFTLESLCIYKQQPPTTDRFRDENFSPRIWIMRSYQVRQSWEQLPCLRCCDPNYLSNPEYNNITYKGPRFCCRSYKIMDYMSTPIFVESLVSPHGDITRPIKTTNGNKALKRKRGDAKNSKTSTVLYEVLPKIRMLVIDPLVSSTSYEYVPKIKAKLLTPDKKPNYQNRLLTKASSVEIPHYLIDRDSRQTFTPCKIRRRSPENTFYTFRTR